MSIRKHQIIGLLILFGVSIYFVFAFKPDLLRKTSDEMVYLRTVEESLQLPETNIDRKERDEGETKDLKGATHYTRNIWNYYKDENTIKQIEKQLENDGWQIVKTEEIDEHQFTRVRIYLKDGVKACISTNIYDQNINKNQYDHFVAIEAPRELGCEIHYYGTVT